MLLERFRREAHLAAILCAAAVAAACGGTGPGPGPKPGAVTVTAVSPATGTTFGGTTITITGSGFAAGATVLIGGAPATDVAVASSTSITAKTPARPAGAATISVTVGTASASLASAFTFVTPSAGPNTPPVVSEIGVQPPRVNQPAALATMGDIIKLTVSVNDAETPVSDLTFQWTAVPNAGTFSASGPNVEWTTPASVSSPQLITLTLTVIERYVEPDPQGLPVQREHKVQRSTAIKVHDSRKEVIDMAVDFWKLFLTLSITSPEAVLHNFSKTCDGGSGYNNEYGDIETHREDIAEILEYTITPPTVFEYAFGSRRACSRKDGSAGDTCVEVPVRVTERVKATNTIREVSGTGFLTGVYEDEQWRLCHSLWTGADTLTGNPVIYDVTERRRIIKGPRDK
jgi:hypothetical protein